MNIVNYHSWLGKISLFSFMSFLFWLIYLAISHGIANLLLIQVDDEIEQWTLSNQLTIDTWVSTHNQLNWALKFDPHNPDLLERMGTLYYWKANISVMLPEILVARQKALDYYWKAVKQKPTTALTYANIILVKDLLGQYDTQFQMALQQATILSPWEPFIQSVVVEIGLSAWQQLSKKGQSIVLATIERGIKSGQATQMSALLKKYQKESSVCTSSNTFFNFCQ
jgi:tetratricopeptide (TPR) repeat protein